MSPLSLASFLPSLLLGQAEAEAAPKEEASPRLKVEAGADIYYGFNLNHPADHASFIPGTGTTAKRADEFSVNLASLGARLEPAPVGFCVLFGAGTAMEVVHSAEPEGVAAGLDVWRYVQEASATFVHGPLTLQAGISPSYIGFESFQSQNNWTYTRGWMAELPDDTTHWRFFGDVIATLKVTNALQLALCVDAGLQQRPGVGDATWLAGGAHARYQLSRPVALAARAEVFHDGEGAISGTAQTLVEGTLTLEVKPAEHLVLKLEARQDVSDADVFSSSRATEEGVPLLKPYQTLVVAGATASF